MSIAAFHVLHPSNLYNFRPPSRTAATVRSHFFLLFVLASLPGYFGCALRPWLRPTTRSHSSLRRRTTRGRQHPTAGRPLTGHGPFAEATGGSRLTGVCVVSALGCGSRVRDRHQCTEGTGLDPTTRFVGRSISRSVGPSVGPSVHQSVRRSVGLSACRPVGRSVGGLFCR